MLKSIYIKEKWSHYLVFLLILFFTVQGIFLVNKIEFGSAPDEVFHYNQIMNFSHSAGPFLRDGDIGEYQNPVIAPEPMGKAYYLTHSKSSFLYHWLMSLLLKFNFFDISDLIFLRLISLIFAILYLFYFYKLTRLILNNDFLVAYTMAIHTMLPMFVFISSAVSYDNLLNLLIILSIYYLFLLGEKKNIEHAFLSLLFMSTAVLVKSGALPIVVILFIFLTLLLVKHKDIWSGLKKKLGERKKKYIIFSMFFLCIFSFNIYVYARNFQVYNRFIPECIDMFDYSACWNENYIFRQEQIFIDTLDKPAVSIASLLEYTYYWLDTMIYTGINFTGHNPGTLVFGDIFIVKIFIIIFLISFFIRSKNIDKKIKLALFIASFYTLTLVLYNYWGFVVNGHPTDKIQGRYVFPVISLMIILFSYYFLSFVKDKNLRYFMIFVLTLCLFFYFNLVILVNLL